MPQERTTGLSYHCHMAAAVCDSYMTTTQLSAHKIIGLYHPYPTRMGGSQRVTLQLARELPELGFLPVLICPQEGVLTDAARQAHIQVRICAPHPRWLVTGTAERRAHRWLSIGHLWTLARYWFTLSRELTAAGIAVLHCHDARGCLMAAPAARLARIPSLWHVHVTPGKGLRRWLDVVFAVLSDFKVFVSRAARREWTLPARLLGDHEVIENGLEDAPPAPAAKRSRPGPLLVTVGALRPEKGQDVLVRALALVRERVPDVRLRIVGEDWAGGAYRARLLAQIAALQLADCIELLGQRTDVAALIAGADACVIASRSESFGLVALEAMQQSRPVIATAVGGLQDIVVDEHTGLLVAPDDAPALAAAILKLLRDPARAAAMGEQGQRRARECFGIRRMAQRFAELYERMLEDASSVGGAQGRAARWSQADDRPTESHDRSPASAPRSAAN